MAVHRSYGDTMMDLAIWLIYTHILSRIPYVPGKLLRNLLIKQRFAHLGKGSSLSTNVRILYPPGIRINNNVGITRDVTLDGRGGLEIGDNTMIGFESIILTCTHNSSRRDIPVREQGFFSAPVKIGCNVWTGTRVVILPGVIIGDNVIIGANSVVNKNIPANTIWGGVPAQFIKQRYN